MSVLTSDQIAAYAYRAGFRGASLAIAVAIAEAESGGNTSIVSTDGYGSVGLWQPIPSTWNGASPQMPGNPPFSAASNPQDNANMAWVVSNHGTNWGPWTTYGNGMYLKFMPAATASASKATGNSGADATLTSSVPPSQNDQLQGISDKLFGSIALADWNKAKPLWHGTDKGWQKLQADARNNSIKNSGSNHGLFDPSYYEWSGTQDQLTAFDNALYPSDTVTKLIDRSPIGQLISAFESILSFITNGHNWYRVALFLLGGMMLIYGLWEMMKDTSVGKAAKSTVKSASKVAEVAAVA